MSDNSQLLHVCCYVPLEFKPAECKTHIHSPVKELI